MGQSRVPEQQDTPESRAARYREMAVESLNVAANTKDPQARAAYLKLVEGWNNLAAEIELLSK